MLRVAATPIKNMGKLRLHRKHKYCVQRQHRSEVLVRYDRMAATSDRKYRQGAIKLQELVLRLTATQIKSVSKVDSREETSAAFEGNAEEKHR